MKNLVMSDAIGSEKENNAQGASQPEPPKDDGMKRIANEIKEHHNYIRAFTTIFIAWFTFFGGVNMTTLGILVKSLLEEGYYKTSGEWLVGVVVSVAMIVFNGIALVACYVFHRYLHSCGQHIRRLENGIRERDGIVPEPQDLSVHAWFGMLFNSLQQQMQGRDWRPPTGLIVVSQLIAWTCLTHIACWVLFSIPWPWIDGVLTCR